MNLAERMEDIRLIRESAASLADRRDFSRVRALRFVSPGFDRAVYHSMAEMGWTGLTVPEDRGGAQLGMLEFCALSEELGGALVPEPLVFSAMAATLLHGEDQQNVLTGKRIILLAWQETANTLDPTGRARFRNGRVNGTKCFVPMAAGADGFVVTSPDGMALVSATDPGLTIEVYPTLDGGHCGTLNFSEAKGKLVPGDPGRALDASCLATSGYLLGIIEGALSLTAEYVKTRCQFGSPIGSFQVLQHRLVDLTLQAELTRASIEQAAILIDEGVGVSTTAAAVSRAKSRASEAALLVTRQCLQMHGGIGYTDEAEIGLFLRKAMVLAASFGSAQVHRDRYASLTLDTDF